ncbi:MAG TPA: 50S ribosomal protein L20 [Tepidisphaeraceae bacterium]|nr:50S ribosomal protein L20 [Tepidisphaeraceae bacterium]
MPRSTGGPTHARKRKRILKRASGFRAGPGTLYRQALEFTRKADVYAYRDRRQKKRHFRTLWITRLNAALKERGINYNRFIPALAASGVTLNRKILSELAISDVAAFDAIVAAVRPHIQAPQKKAAAA